jgi:tetratricopeptide (TPR) repeat protein
LSVDDPIQESPSRRFSLVWLAIVCVLAIILIVLLAGKFRTKLPSPTGDPLDGSIILRTTGDYDKASRDAALFAKQAFQKLAVGQTLDATDIKNLRSAARLYDAMSAFEPASPAPDFACGQILHALGFEDHAETKFRQFLTSVGPSPKDDGVKVMVADSHGLLAACLTATHNYKAALAEADTALEMYPRTASYLVERASAELQLHQEGQAKLDLEDAMRGGDPSDPAEVRASAMLKLLDAKT